MQESSSAVDVLLVDDEQDIRIVARLTLQTGGNFHIREACSGEEALRMVESRCPDLILLDVMMPGMDGPQLLAELKKRPERRSIRVVFLTAKAMPDEIRRLRELGAASIIIKPFDPAKLVAEINSVLFGEASGLVQSDPPDCRVPVSEASIDHSQLEKLQELSETSGEDFLADLVELFASHTPERLQELRDAASVSPSKAERIAHAIKGSAATLGAIELARLAKAIEVLASQGCLDDTLPLIDEAYRLLEPTLSQLRQEAQRLRAK